MTFIIIDDLTKRRGMLFSLFFFHLKRKSFVWNNRVLVWLGLLGASRIKTSISEIVYLVQADRFHKQIVEFISFYFSVFVFANVSLCIYEYVST